jgi:hypothetical protein
MWMIEDQEEDFGVAPGSGEAYIWTRELRELLTDEGVDRLEHRYGPES